MKDASSAASLRDRRRVHGNVIEHSISQTLFDIIFSTASTSCFGLDNKSTQNEKEHVTPTQTLLPTETAHFVKLTPDHQLSRPLHRDALWLVARPLVHILFICCFQTKPDLIFLEISLMEYPDGSRSTNMSTDQWTWKVTCEGSCIRMHQTGQWLRS